MNQVAAKVLTLGHVNMGTGTFEPFDQVFDNALCVTPQDIYDRKIDCLVIWGGADISPSIYGEEVGRKTYAGRELSHRDTVEVAVCKAAIDMGIPIIGVCRGAQLLCALAGGKLVQDVQNHGTSHSMTTNDGRSIVTSSVHHQMMYPWDVDHELIAWSSEARSHDYVGVDVEKMVDPDASAFIREPEIVYFPTVKGLAIQGHPEFMRDTCEFVQYCNKLVTDYLLS